LPRPMSRRVVVLTVFGLVACGGAHLSVPGPSAGGAASPPSIVEPDAAATTNGTADGSAPHPAEPSPPVEPRVARLARLARIWGDVAYTHPYLWEDRDINWDAALVAAMPAVDQAKTDHDEASAVGRMLDAIHDPITRVEASPPPGSNLTRGHTSVAWPGSGTLVVKLAPNDWGEAGRDAASLAPEIDKAKVVVFDLRSPEDSWLPGAVLNVLAGQLVSRECVAPASRAIQHSGYRPQRGDTSGGYFTAFVTTAPRSFEPGKGPHPVRVVFVVNEHTAVPDLVFAMQRTGDAAIVAQGTMTDPAMWTRSSIPLAGGQSAFARTVEVVPNPAPDVTIAASKETEGGEALARGVKLAEGGWPKARRAFAVQTLPPARWRPDQTYPDEAYPPPEHRLLALFRFWNVIRLFYPYLHLMEPGAWDRALTDFIPKMEQAKNASEYALVLGELAARIPDSHVRVNAKAFWRFLGRPLYGFAIQRIEGQPVITGLDDAEESTGLRLGDVVVSIDGEPFEARAARVRPYIASSNAWTLARDADTYATGGPEDSEAVMRVRGADGAEREVRVKRVAWTPPPIAHPAYKTLEGGSIGYVDLRSLGVEEVDMMFAALANTRAIVFDLRRGPRGTFWAITPHLNVRKNAAGGSGSRALVGFTGNPEAIQSRFVFTEPLPNDDRPKYTGKTVVLMNEFTQSQAEGTAMGFKEANGTIFVGSRTAGANGDITNSCLPGGICISFSGQEARWANGDQLQRVGLKPDVEVRPTIEGLRAGRDEVLDRAIRYLRDGH
jgi:C-terminal processing protease CtpA/Prc